MLTQNIGMDVLLAYADILGKAGAQTRGIKNSAGADNAVLRNSADLAEYICQHIHGVAYDYVQGIGGRIW